MMCYGKSLIYGLLKIKNIFFLMLGLYFILAINLSKEFNIFFLLFILWGAYIVINQKNKIKVPPPVRNLLIIFGMVFLTVTLNIVFHGNIEQLFNFKYEVYRDLIFLYFIAVLFIYYRLDYQSVFKLVAFVSLYAFVYIFFIVWENPVRGDGLLGTPISRGNMGMLIGVMSLISFFGLHSKKWKVVAFIGFFSGVFLSLLSGSRGGWLTVVVVAFTVWVVFYKIDKKLFLISTCLFIFFLFLLVLLWPYLPVSLRIEEVLNDLVLYFNGNFETSVGYRLEMWKAAFFAFLEKPIFGWGFDSFGIIFSEYIELNYNNTDSYIIFGHPHNDYLSFLVETGLVGFLFIFLSLIYPFFMLLKLLRWGVKSNNRDLIFLSLLGVVLIEAIMEFMLSDQTITMKYQFHFYIMFILLIFVTAFKSKKMVESIK